MQKNYSYLYLGNLEKSYRHLNEGLECLLVIKGNLEVELDGSTSHLNQDDIIIINMNQVHSIKGNKDNIVLRLTIQKEFFKTEYKDLLSKTIRCDSSQMEEGKEKLYYECKRLLTRMLLIYTEKKTGFYLEFQAVFYLFLHHIALYFVSEEKIHPNEQINNESIKTDGTLEEVLLYMQNNYDKSFSLDEAAAMAYMSPQYFSKYFKRKIGIGFLEYLTTIRLKQAVHSLLYSEQSIIKIAMAHGFANAKSFTIAFKKEYGDTPSEYRKKYQQKNIGDEHENRDHKFDIQVEDSLIAFLKYLHQHNTNQPYGPSKTQSYSIDITKLTPKTFQKPCTIINVEHLQNLRKAEIIEQLKDIKNRLNFSYVYFNAFEDTESLYFNRGDSFDYYELFQTVKTLYELNLIPIIHLDFSKIKRMQQWNNPTKDFTDYLKNTFQVLIKQFPLWYMKKWKLELSYTKEEDSEEFFSFYKSISLFSLNYLEQKNIGMLAFKNHSHTEYQQFRQFLTQAKKNSCIPGFISFYAYPEEHLFHAFIENYQKISNYHQSLVRKIKEVSAETDSHIDDFYMIKWNTLAGKNIAETGKFFRSALILDVYWSVKKEITGFGIHLNTFEVSKNKERTDTSVLALYLYDKIRRPVFFILEALERIGNKVLIKNEYLFVTKKMEDEYAVLFYHPRYVNPSNSIDPIFIKENSLHIELELKGLTKGKYQEKTFLLDQDNGGVFSRWESAGYPDFMDNDVIEYLERAVIPNLIVREIPIDNTYCMKQKLTFNGVILSIIKKL